MSNEIIKLCEEIINTKVGEDRPSCVNISCRYCPFEEYNCTIVSKNTIHIANDYISKHKLSLSNFTIEQLEEELLKRRNYEKLEIMVDNINNLLNEIRKISGDIDCNCMELVGLMVDKDCNVKFEVL